MANEHTLVIETHRPISIVVANGLGFEKGTLLKLSGSFLAASQTANNDVCGGVAQREKIAANGQTQTAVYRGGVFKGTISGTVTLGSPLIADSTANMLRAPTTMSGANVWGLALESGTTGQTILWELRPWRNLGNMTN